MKTKMIDTPCPNPACTATKMPAPPNGERNNVWVRCPDCGFRARAAFADMKDGAVVVRYTWPRNMTGRKKVVRRVSPELDDLLDYNGAEQAAIDFLRRRDYTSDCVTPPYKT